MNPEVLRAALAAVGTGEPFALVTVIEVEGSSPGSLGQQMIVYGDGRQEGTVGGGALEARSVRDALAMLRAGRGGLLTYSLDPDSAEGIGAVCGGKALLSVEVSAPAGRILCGGAGHVSFAFARLCRELGLPYAVVDSRAEQVTAERFPGALALHAFPVHEWIERNGLAGFTHVVLFTHNHVLDGKALLAAARTGYTGYVGMIGSRRKWQEVRTTLLEAGVDEAWLARVHCPVGLPIGARSPAEIAVSIAAEILQESRVKPQAGATTQAEEGR